MKLADVKDKIDAHFDSLDTIKLVKSEQNYFCSDLFFSIVLV